MTVSDFPPVIWTMSRSLRLQLAQKCPDYPGIQIAGVRITEGILYMEEHWSGVQRRNQNIQPKDDEEEEEWMNEAQTRLYSFEW